jgi:hypothetical protein
MSGAQAGLAANWPLSGKEKGTAAKNHRTVRWANSARGQRSAVQSAGDAWPAPTVGWAYRTVRWANWTQDPTVDCVRLGRKSSTGHVLFMSGDAPDCLVHHSTEGKICLPSWSPTAPSCLGDIKETPRRMEQYTKHSLSILRLLDSASTYLDCCASDLSSVWVVNSLCRVLSSSLGLCACVCCGLSLACVAFPPLLMCFLCDHHCKGERLQLVEIPRKREKTTEEDNYGTQSWSLDHLRGIECNPWPKEVTTTWK